MRTIHADAIERMDALGRAGFTVSVCCGPSGDKPIRWSVIVMSKDGEAFDEPFAALSFEHAIDIAFVEITKRGW